MSLQQSATRGQQRGIGGLPLRPAALAGLVTFVVGYLVTYVVKIGDVNEALQSPLIDLSTLPTPADWQVIGWYFLGAHNVAIEATTRLGGSMTTSALDLDVPTWLMLIPPGFLLVAGFSVVRYVEFREPLRGALAGASITIAYVVGVVVLALLSAWTVSEGGNASLQVAPALLSSVIVAGVAYPVVFGGLGGALAAVVTS